MYIDGLRKQIEVPEESDWEDVNEGGEEEDDEEDVEDGDSSSDSSSFYGGGSEEPKPKESWSEMTEKFGLAT